MKRRMFLMTPGLFAAREASGWQGANDRVQVGVIGVRGRGRDHITHIIGSETARVAVVCDIDQAVAERAQAFTEKAGGGRPAAVGDMRKLFENKSIDAVSIANCNHWHALSAIWACQAGKHVYVEKPASHNVWEGRKMVEAAAKYKRVVQVGMQSRSIAHKIEAVKKLREGAIGRVYMAKGLCFKRRLPIGIAPDGPVPPGVNYDLWLGPAPQRPFNPNRFHYTWHWFWDYGNGDIGNQGVHELDIARWGLGLKGLPRKVYSGGRKFVQEDDQETPNTQMAVFDYGNLEIIFEVRGQLTNGEGSISFDGGNFIGNLFYGSEGFMAVDSQGYQIFRGEKREKVEDVKAREPRIWDTQPHMNNFLAAVKKGDAAGLNAPIEEGHLSAALCHLANISYRVGKNLAFDAEKETFPGDAAAAELLTRKYRAPYAVPAVV